MWIISRPAPGFRAQLVSNPHGTTRAHCQLAAQPLKQRPKIQESKYLGQGVMLSKGESSTFTASPCAFGIFTQNFIYNFLPPYVSSVQTLLVVSGVCLLIAIAVGGSRRRARLMQAELQRLLTAIAGIEARMAANNQGISELSLSYSQLTERVEKDSAAQGLLKRLAGNNRSPINTRRQRTEKQYYVVTHLQTSKQ
ncbi:hypothetical protein WJX82_000623 [Trebouxia sp. C0006]